MNYQKTMNVSNTIDLEKILIQKSISQEHINYLKTTKPQDLKEYDKYYNQYQTYNNLISPLKILGINRANKNYSFWDNATDTCKSCFNKNNMGLAIEHILNDKIDEIYQWYKEYCEPVKVAYYLDDDVYRITSNGNHRALYAIMVCAPKIKAIVTEYRKDEDLYKNFLNYKRICEKYAIEKQNVSLTHTVITTFHIDDNIYDVCGYIMPDIKGVDFEYQLKNLELQLSKDFKYIRKRRLIRFLEQHPLLKAVYLQCVCISDHYKHNRLLQHINKINIDSVYM